MNQYMLPNPQSCSRPGQCFQPQAGGASSAYPGQRPPCPYEQLQYPYVQQLQQMGQSPQQAYYPQQQIPYYPESQGSGNGSCYPPLPIYPPPLPPCRDDCDKRKKILKCIQSCVDSKCHGDCNPENRKNRPMVVENLIINTSKDCSPSTEICCTKEQKGCGCGCKGKKSKCTRTQTICLNDPCESSDESDCEEECCVIQNPYKSSCASKCKSKSKSCCSISQPKAEKCKCITCCPIKPEKCKKQNRIILNMVQPPKCSKPKRDLIEVINKVYQPVSPYADGCGKYYC